MTRALYLYGGWPGHYPYEIAAWARELFKELDFDVEESTDIFTLDRDLKAYAQNFLASIVCEILRKQIET